MSHGNLDQVARDAIKRAAADAAKRGLRIIAVTSRYVGGQRSFTFDYEPVRKARKSDSQIATDVPPAIGRGGIPKQGELL